MLVMSAKGLYGCPKADIAVFADTQDEASYTYQHLAAMREFGRKHGIPVHVTTAGKLSADTLNRPRFVSVPLYTGNDGKREGMLRRQCSREYKITPIAKFVRAHLGYEPRQRIRERVTALIGISIDEAHRMKPSWFSWITNRWPLVDAELTRRDCKQILRDAGLPIPEKSSCVYCPYKSDADWLALPSDAFDQAVDFDRAIRHRTMKGEAQPAFIHRSCQPLDQVDFDPMKDQIDMFGNECEGMCGV